MIRTYSDLISLPTFEERFNYLKLQGQIGEDTFGHLRYLNQSFYRTQLWRDARRKAVIRDNACDLGIDGLEILGRVYVHHIEPITEDDLIYHRDILTDLDNLITCSYDTHTAITYGLDISTPRTNFVTRKEGDTLLWKPIKRI